MSANEIILIIGAVGTFISMALVPGVILIIKELKGLKADMVENTTTTDKIHRLTNSAHTTSLQLVADSALKTAKTTGDPDDFLLFESAEKALDQAKTATRELEEADDLKESR